MVCIVLLLSLAAVWISNKTVGLLEIHYFKRPLSMEYAAWLRVMCAGLLFIFIQMVPAFTFLYTPEAGGTVKSGRADDEAKRGL